MESTINDTQTPWRPKRRREKQTPLPEAGPYTVTNRLLTDAEIGEFRRVIERANQVIPASAYVKPALWTISTILCALGFLCSLSDPVLVDVILGLSIIMLVPSIIGTYFGWQWILLGAGRPSQSMAEECKAVIDDGYAVVETFAPSRVAFVEGDEDIGSSYVFQLDEGRVAICQDYWYSPSFDENPSDFEKLWPNDLFQVVSARSTSRHIRIDLLGDYLKPCRRYEFETATSDSLEQWNAAYGASFDCIQVLDGAMDDILSMIVGLSSAVPSQAISA